MDALRTRVLELLRRHGRDAVSFQVLEPGLEYWFDGDDACVAYARVAGGRAWVAAGGPIAPRDREVEVARRFVAAARTAGWRARLFGLERDLAHDPTFATLKVGVQPVWDPRRWAATLAGHRSLREQLRRARNKGVTIRLVASHELADPTSPTRRGIDALIARWLASRSMAPMQFVVSLVPYDLPDERLFLVAERAGAPVGILVAVPIYARGGWLFEDVLRDPAAPNGTVELLFDAAMRRLAALDCDHATFGLAPLAEVDAPLLRFARRAGRRLYDFAGLLRFKQKLGPQASHPIYVAFPRGDAPVRAMLDVLRAFAGGGLVAFGGRTLLHRAPDVTRVLAGVLVGWIVVLALAPTAPWFPSTGVKVAWLVFDIAIVAGLVALARRWRPRFARCLAGVALVDCALGCAQAWTWNLPRLTGASAAIVTVAALAAPLAAAVFLFAARDRNVP